MYFFRTACFSYICVADFRCRFLPSLAPKMLKSPGPAPPEKYANRRIPNKNRKYKKTIVIHKAVGRFSGRHHKLNTIAKTAIPKTTGFSKKCFAGTWHFSKISGKTFFPNHHSKTVAGGSSSRGGRPAGPKFKKTPKSGFVIFRGAPCSVRSLSTSDWLLNGPILCGHCVELPLCGHCVEPVAARLLIKKLSFHPSSSSSFFFSSP